MASVKVIGFRRDTFVQHANSSTSKIYLIRWSIWPTMLSRKNARNMANMNQAIRFHLLISSAILTANNPNTSFGRLLIPKWRYFRKNIQKLATDAIKAVYTKIDPLKKEFSFEIFGLDFMIDENFKVWLIEANTNPCLELSSPLLGRIIPSMIENTFRYWIFKCRIAIDPIFMPPHENSLLTMRRPIIPENMLENNKFELVFDETEERKDLKTLLTNTPNI
jgi:hypothetical protein